MKSKDFSQFSFDTLVELYSFHCDFQICFTNNLQFKNTP